MALLLGEMSLGLGEVGLRLACAIVAGVALGWDREVHEKPAGLRTYVLVSLGSALLAVIAAEYMIVGSAGGSVDGVRMDPLRIIAGVVGGIGFLGAGTIIQSGGKVEGLTSAAGLWLVAGLGMAFGLGFYALGAMAGLAGFVTLVVLLRVQARMGVKRGGSSE